MVRQDHREKIVPYPFYALLAVMLFASVHLFTQKLEKFSLFVQGKFLSFGGGVAISYVFIDLLPKLSKKGEVLQQAFYGILPFVERNAYIMALLGFLLFFAVDRTAVLGHKKTNFWLSLSSYILFNFLIGYAVVDKDDPEVRPLLLFTFAMSLHYFVIDFSLNAEHKKSYRKWGKWALSAALFLGWLLGFWITLPPAAIALIGAFIAGGVIMNVTRHELPAKNPTSLSAFLFSALIYSFVLLFLG